MINATPEKLVIVTGLSGAGKSYVQSTLEDLGFYSADNLPVSLIEPFLDEVVGREGKSRIAIVMDVRAHDFARTFPRYFTEVLKARFPHAILIFLDARDEVLVRRFSETRRPHPYGVDLPILDAIGAERRELTDVKAIANMVLDTSQFSVHELKAEINRRFQLPGYVMPMLVNVMTFGFKYAIPPNIDLMFDVRFLPNPHFVEGLRPRTGCDAEVVSFLESHAEYGEFFSKLCGFVEYVLPQYEREMKSYLTIGVGCTGGKHRSVAIGEKLGERLAEIGYRVEITHRDMGK
ncbi:MAG: RNase adapter RapZ [Thermoanaerobaculia bacterium]